MQSGLFFGALTVKIYVFLKFHTQKLIRCDVIEIYIRVPFACILSIKKVSYSLRPNPKDLPFDTFLSALLFAKGWNCQMFLFRDHVIQQHFSFFGKPKRSFKNYCLSG